MMGSPIARLERSHTSEDKEQVVMVSTFPCHLAQDTAEQCAYLLFGCCNGHLTGLLNFPFSVLHYTRAHFILPQSKGFSGGSPLLINSNKLLPQNFRPSIPSGTPLPSQTCPPAKSYFLEFPKITSPPLPRGYFSIDF